MVIGNISEIQAGECKYPAAIQKALHFLAEHDFAKMQDAKYPIDGDNSFAILQRYNPRLEVEGKPEAHRQYIDIQYIVDGSEEIGWCPMSPELVVDDDYDAEKDIVFFRNLVPESSIVLQSGDFAILFPVDIHMPCGAIDNISAPVTKVVVKVAVDCVE